MNYNSYQLQEVCSFIDYRGKTPPKTSHGIPLITAKIVKGGKILPPTEFIADEYYDEWMRRGIPRKGAVLFTTEAPLGEVAQITTDEKLAFAQRIIILQADESRLCNDYLLYALQHGTLRNRILSKATGTTVTGIKAAELKTVVIDLPPLSVQKRIASICKSLDSKIAINEKINDNLAQQAQAIYVDMFITNANPAWPLGHLSDLITVKYGKDHKKLDDGPYPVYGSGGIMRYAERALYAKESVLIPRKGTLNNVIYVNEPFWSVDTMFFTEMKLPNVAKYVYHYVKSKDLASLNAGSAVPSMTTDILNAMELLIPDVDSLLRFESIVSPVFLAMHQNTQESSKLAETRDAMLPRLMSGEIDISALKF